ncbi:MAG TPA: hypothetical protein VFM32_02670 [Spongiibacteraceae bacterium]|nr:hypothetical protein [Spongiibacteraceae bacterium]
MSAKLISLATLAVLMLAGCQTAEKPSATATEKPKAPHEQLIERLQASNTVLPPKQNLIELWAMYNREAPIPPQCYTRTEGKHNPCYVCHQNAIPGHENVMNDGELQSQYEFSDTGMNNHWRNLFEDRSARVAAISDEEILHWIDADNYSELAPRLREANFQGWIPDIKNLQLGADAFDSEGFAKDGSQWVAFNYKPMPSTFWPTNGSTDDVMIRLPIEFRSDENGNYSRDIYRINLAILEASIKNLPTMSIDPIDENRVGIDLDGNHKLNITTSVKARDHFIGGAKTVATQAFIYPLGTEFLHTVRYIGVAQDGGIHNASRMKEVRYMKRFQRSDSHQLELWYKAEINERETGELPSFINLGQRGLGTPMGWELAGFIEDRNGRLRANTFEETMYCMGCHSSIGTTIDKTFSFARKIDGTKGWTYLNLHGMPDAPNVGEREGEILTYLERNGGGSEFRNNDEMEKRFYHADGSVNREAVTAANDVYALITPSRERALLLNKAYKVIVADQDYLYGRDATITPPKNVYRKVDEATAPVLPESLQYAWDIRLQWSRQN